MGSNHNFMSDKSLSKVCFRSKHSLEDLALKNAVYLTNESILENLSLLQRLVRLDLSYTKQIDDVVIKAIATKMRSLKKISLRFLNEITSDSIVMILDQQKMLEGLDISGCFKVNLDSTMVKLRDNKHLRCLLLEYLFIQPQQLYHLKATNIQTISLFCK